VNLFQTFEDLNGVKDRQAEILMIYHAIVQAYGSPRRCAR
jgi:hypothetical protein